MILTQLLKVSPQHVVECQVNTALCPRQQIYSLQLVIDIAKLSNLAVMYRSRDIKKGNWNYPIGANTKDGGKVVVMGPSVIKMLLDFHVSCCL
jgi:hypothetical protein